MVIGFMRSVKWVLTIMVLVGLVGCSANSSNTPSPTRIESAVFSLAFNPHTQSLVAGYGGFGGYAVRLWDLQQQPVTPQVLNGYTGTVAAVAFSPDGALLATASEDSVIRVWN